MRSTPVYARNASDHQCKDHVNYQISIITFWTESTRSWFAVSSASKAWCSCSLLWRFVMSRNDSSEAISVFSPIHPSTYTNTHMYIWSTYRSTKGIYILYMSHSAIPLSILEGTVGVCWSLEVSSSSAVRVASNDCIFQGQHLCNLGILMYKVAVSGPSCCNGRRLVMPVTDELCSMLSELGQFLFLIEQKLFKVRVFGKQWLNRAQGILQVYIK